MKFVPHRSSLVLAALLVSGSALAGGASNPYQSWQHSSDDDVSVAIEDSFKRSETNTRSEDNDVDLRFKSSQDNDHINQHSEDNDVELVFKTSEDNDIADSYNTDTKGSYNSDYSQDNDVTTSWRARLDIDSIVATPTMTATKDQDQHAGHQGYADSYGVADGHDTAVYGGQTSVSAGNDEQVFLGPAMVSTNTNILPSNDLMIGGHNSGPIGMSNTSAGRDLGDKGVFAPVGNTTVGVSGDVGQASTSVLEQSGDSGNIAEDIMSSGIGR